MLGGYCRGQPLGSPKTTGEAPLKTCKKPKLNTPHLSTPTGHGPHRGGPRGPQKAAHSRVPSSKLHLARGYTPPSSRFRLARGFTAPSSGLRLVRGSLTRTPAPARGYGHLMLWHGGRRHHAPGNHAPALSHQLPRGNPSPPLWRTVRRGRCQPRDTAPPTPIRLTCRALEGGPPTPSNCFLVNLQGQVMMLGRWDAIPATVGCGRPPPCVQHHAGHCYNSFGAVRHARTGRRHACHCIPYGLTSVATSSPSENATANHYAPALEATTVRVQDTP
jgi:hypothetical protein